MMAVYNEADIVAQVLDFHIAQGLEMVVIDNGSTDASREVLREREGRGVTTVERIVTDTFEWQMLLERLTALAARWRPDWGVLIGADEFLEAPRASAGERLAEGLAEQARQGYDVVQFDAYEFCPTSEDDAGEADVRRRMQHYTWTDACHFRAFRWHPGVSLTEAGGHYPAFPAGVAARVSPNRFALRHYKFRSIEHGMRKVFDERLPRFRDQPTGWNVHYAGHRSLPGYFSRAAEDLSRYHEDGRWERVRHFDTSYGTHVSPDEYWTPPGMVRDVAFADLERIRGEGEALRAELTAIKATRFWRVASMLWRIEARLLRLLGRAERNWPPA
jgi:hypothetical protein